MLICVFFFTQKTAYEMRISDWSSDVCSSDLALIDTRPANRGLAGACARAQKRRCSMSRDQAIVMRYDSPDEGGDSRDIVYLHGRGSTEREAGFALSLFGNANVRAYRGPIAQGGGFAWFLNAGPGTAGPQGIAPETAKIGNWIAADPGRRLPWLNRKSVR